MLLVQLQIFAVNVTTSKQRASKNGINNTHTHIMPTLHAFVTRAYYSGSVA
jgi:hypothetical protein